MLMHEFSGSAAMPDHRIGIIGYRAREDGTEHAVYRDAAGRQFMVDGKGRRSYGVWFTLAAEESPQAEEELEPEDVTDEDILLPPVPGPARNGHTK
jgi:hypothetical protein